MRAWAAIWKLRIALVAACVLLLQSVSGAFAGDLPVRATLDAFGNPICTSHSGHDGDTGRSGLPGCCTLACSMFSAATLAGAMPGAFGPNLAAIIAFAGSAAAPRIHLAAPGYDPARPRAPPVVA